MILTRAPLRVSFFGGGSDLPAYYTKSPSGGVCLSTAIDKYMYIALIETPKKHVKLMYSEIEIVDNVDKIKHDIVRNALNHFSFKSGIEIGSFADIPTAGTGLGSSSTFTVALMQGLHYLRHGRDMSPYKLSEEACNIEIDMCGKSIGKQDQYASAYGGTNLFQFKADGDVDITPVETYLRPLNNNLMMFYTGKTRSANDILAKQSKAMNEESKFVIVDEMVKMTYEAYDHLMNDEIDNFGALLDKTWSLKKQLANGISDAKFDSIYKSAMTAGALGGKLLGAGGGGYFLFYVPEDNQEAVAEAVGLERFDFTINAHGAEIVYDSETGGIENEFYEEVL